jgi:hypothetical protein
VAQLADRLRPLLAKETKMEVLRDVVAVLKLHFADEYAFSNPDAENDGLRGLVLALQSKIMTLGNVEDAQLVQDSADSCSIQ